MSDIDLTDAATILSPSKPSEPSPSPEPSTAESTADERSRILATIVAETRTADLPPVWSFLDMTSNFRRLRFEPPDLVAALLKAHSVEQLRDTRILVPHHGEFQLNSVFGGPSDSFLVCEVDGRPVNVASARGALVAANIPAMKYLLPRFKPGVKGQPNFVLLPTSDADFQIARGLGYPSTPAAGLASMTGLQVRQFFDRDSAAGELRQYRGVLPAWGLAQLVNRPSAEFRSILQHLRKIPAVYGRDVNLLLDVWSPAPESMERIRAALAFSDVKIARKLLGSSLAKERYTILEFSTMLDRKDQHRAAATNLSAGLARLSEVLAKPYDFVTRQEICEASRAVIPALNRMLPAKFWEAAQEATNPIDATLLMLCSELASHHAGKLRIVTDAKRVVNDQRPPLNEIVVDPDTLAEQMKLANVLVQIRRTIAPKKN